MLGNIPAKFCSRLENINLVLLANANLIKKYGYSEILSPLFEDLVKLETEGTVLQFETRSHFFRGTISMVVADNLAAHALGGFFCNFSTVNRFCRFCCCTQYQLTANTKLADIPLRTIAGYSNNDKIIEQDPSLCSAYVVYMSYSFIMLLMDCYQI